MPKEYTVNVPFEIEHNNRSASRTLNESEGSSTFWARGVFTPKNESEEELLARFGKP